MPGHGWNLELANIFAPDNFFPSDLIEKLCIIFVILNAVQVIVC